MDRTREDIAQDKHIAAVEARLEAAAKKMSDMEDAIAKLSEQLEKLKPYEAVVDKVADALGKAEAGLERFKKLGF